MSAVTLVDAAVPVPAAKRRRQHRADRDHHGGGEPLLSRRRLSYGPLKAAVVNYVSQLARSSDPDGIRSERRLTRTDLHRRRLVGSDPAEEAGLLRGEQGPASLGPVRSSRGGRQRGGLLRQPDVVLGERPEPRRRRIVHAAHRLLTSIRRRDDNGGRQMSGPSSVHELDLSRSAFPGRPATDCTRSCARPGPFIICLSTAGTWSRTPGPRGRCCATPSGSPPGSTSTPSHRAEVAEQVARIRIARRWPCTSRRWAPTTRRTTPGYASSSNVRSPPGRWRGWSRWYARPPEEPRRCAARRRRDRLPRGVRRTAAGVGYLAGARVCRSRDATTIRRWSVAAAASIGGMPEPQAWIDNERTLLHYQQTMAARDRGRAPSAPRGTADHPRAGRRRPGTRARNRSRWRSCSPCFASW